MAVLSRTVPLPHQNFCRSYNPASVTRCGLGSSAFARHYLRNNYCSLFLPVLRCFSSQGSSPCGGPSFTRTGCPIRTPADQWPFAPPRSFSQLTASFVISWSLGIHHAPFFASFLFYRRTVVSNSCRKLLQQPSTTGQIVSVRASRS